MWIDTEQGKRLVTELTRLIVGELAPEELELFDELIEDFFARPLHRDRSWRSADDPLGFGGDVNVTAVTPAAASMVSVLVSQALSQSAEPAGEENADTVIRVMAGIRREQLDDIWDLARQRAVAYGMDASQAERMQQVLVASLSIATEQSPLEPLMEEAEPHAGLQRYANVCMTRAHDRSVVPRTFDLGADKTYLLRYDIGPLSPDSVVENAGEEPIPPLPESEEGQWLEVIVVSDEFRVSAPRAWLFLPNEGPSWVCTCDRASLHICTPETREQHLHIELATPGDASSISARLRIGLYYRKNLIQSQLLRVAIGQEEGPGKGYASRIDYTLSGKLSEIGSFAPRTMNILTNCNSNGTHKLVINGLEDEVIDFNLTAKMKDPIGTVRQALRDIHFEEPGRLPWAQPKNLFDSRNSKPREAFLGDVTRLAWLGYTLWSALLEGRPQLRDRLRLLLGEPASIQVSRTGGSEFVFPWGLVYDIPLESDAAKYQPCSLLRKWDQLADMLEEGLRICPYESEHMKNVICPFGFWGFKHSIEQPPSMPEDRTLPVTILGFRGKLQEVVVGRSTDLDEILTDAHVNALRDRFAASRLKDCETLEELVRALADPAIAIVYFYCHGRRKPIPGAEHPIPFIEVGSGERIFPSDLVAWDDADWEEGHWRETSPLVFINGCHTVEIEPESLVNFVDAFAGAYAAGVIGTEIAVHQQVANEAAELFFEAFERNQRVGDSLRLMRNRFLRKGNLLGLAYTAYCSMDLRLAE